MPGYIAEKMKRIQIKADPNGLRLRVYKRKCIAIMNATTTPQITNVRVSLGCSSTRFRAVSGIRSRTEVQLKDTTLDISNENRADGVSTLLTADKVVLSYTNSN